MCFAFLSLYRDWLSEIERKRFFTPVGGRSKSGMQWTICEIKIPAHNTWTGNQLIVLSINSKIKLGGKSRVQSMVNQTNYIHSSNI